MRLPLEAKPYRNLNESAQVGIARFYDAIKNDAMGNERRPGLGGPTSNYFISLGTGKPVDTVYEWEYQGLNISVSGGRIFKVQSSGTATEITGATLLDNGLEATFADFGTTIYMANGGKIVKWTAVNSTCSYIADPDAPTTVSHLGFIDQYLMALDTTADQIKFADVSDPDNWLGEFFSAESLKDKSRAMLVGWREITVFGSKSTEYFGNTGNSVLPFQRFEGANTERGTIAPYSIQKIDNTWFFLDQERKVIRLAGRDPQVVSNPFDLEIQKMDTVSDCKSMHITCNGLALYILSFPSEGRTFCYDYKLDVWSEWSYWNQDTGEREEFLGNTSCYMSSWNKHLVGSRKDDKIYYASKDYYQDGSDVCVFEMWLGWIGNGQWTTPSELILQVRRGDGPASTTPEPFLEVYYRDRNANPNDNNTYWVGPKHVNLGQLGEMDHFARIFRLGRYRNRQYRFVCAENTPVVISGAVEYG